MAARAAWTGTAADLLRLGIDRSSDPFSNEDSWPRSPRAPAGRLRQAQTPLRSLGIEIAFNRESGSNNRNIRITRQTDSIVTTVTTDVTYGKTGPPGFCTREQA
jgi:hypothetical protein